MEVNQFDPNVDYNLILPIHQKRTLTFINHFVTSTVSFLNNFCESCESRLLEFDYKLQKVEASLLILEAQLASIPDIEIVDNGSLPVNKAADLDTVDLPEVVAKEENAPPEASATPQVDVGAPVACEDPRFKKYFNMVRYGVKPEGVKQDMVLHGVDPSILDRPNEVIPGYVPPSSTTASNSDTDTDSD